ncbi:DUF4394 domain-containing protein [Chiayiivirga flava]|uniref:DUF4394 domain-containing protein n=1 Tax=Chiayiivirga flava TaxID=659595 RepID=A0A7W8D654_9GAMM|nr:DUF4394 domain-containing protein [Chiayiivirga flava]MBB5208646.1 hypothetical protein [Chiayiivirga flava]
MKCIPRCIVLAALVAASPAAFAQTVIGLNDGNTLVRFSASAPGAVPATVPVSGLDAGETLLGIDFRPATGALYGVGDAGNLYVIDPVTGVATTSATLDVALDGSVFGVDFNPVPDRLRVVSDTGQNLRINVDTGATLVDGPINPAGPQLVAAGYINSVNPAPMTTALYVVDVVTSDLLLQAPPNDGTVTAVGDLGVVLDASGDHSLDVLTVGAVNTAYAAFRVGGTTTFYTIDLATGAATSRGAVGGNPALRGIAVTAATLPPAAVPGTAIGLDGANGLVLFSSAAPAGAATVRAVTGLTGGDQLVGIDFRPATGALYALASSGRLYTVDPQTGAATLASTLSVAPSGTSFGVDFNPVPDRLRVVSNTGQNLRVNVDTGETLVDGPINPAGPAVAGSAYINSVNPAPAGTALYDIDPNSDTLFLQNPPNDGTVVAIGALGVAVDANTGFDVLSSGGTNTAIAALTVGGATGLYGIDLTTGAATLIGNVSGNPTLRGLALSAAVIGNPAPPTASMPNVVPATSPLFLLLVGLGVLGLAGFAMRRGS